MSIDGVNITVNEKKGLSFLCLIKMLKQVQKQFIS